MCVSHSVTGPSETCFFQSFKTENIAYTTPCTPHHCADTHHLHHTPPTRSQLHHPPTCELFLLQLTVREVECRLAYMKRQRTLAQAQAEKQQQQQQQHLERRLGAIHKFTTSSAYTIHHLMPYPQSPPALSVKAKPAAATKVPYIHTPPHQHTPYTTLWPMSHAHRSVFSDGAAKPAPFGSWHKS